MASINSNTYDGRYMTLTVTQTKGTSSQNYSTINWTLTVSGGNSKYYTTGPTDVVIDGVNRYHCDRKAWSSYAFPAAAGSVSGSFTKNHNNDGTCGAIGFSLSTAIYTASVSSWSGSLGMESIPRYANITTWKLNSYNETSVSCKWGADATCDAIQYSLNGGGWTGWSGNPDTSISGLTPGTTYTVKLRVRRKDSQLWTESNALSFTTYKYPYLTSKPNFKIGDSLSIGFYNPLGRKVYIYIQNPKGTEKGGDNTTGTSISGYTSEEWKNFFYDGIPDSPSGTYKVRITCDTGNVNTTETGGTYTIRSEDSEKPTFDASYITSLTNSLNTDISGTDKFIKNHNKLNVIIKPMGLNKSANGKEYSISANGLATVTKAYSTSNISFEMGNMSSNTLNVTAYDKRDLYRSASKTITLIDYSNPKISNVKINRENGIGTKVLIEVNGIYTNWSGLLKNNTIQTIQYRTKLSTASSYGSWQNLPSDAVKTISGGNWKLTAKLSDTFVNTSNYNIQFKFNDLLETIESSSYSIGTAEALLWRDLTNKRIGIGKKPNYTLDVDGTIHASDIISGKIRTTAMAIVGSDEDGSHGWYKVCTQTMSGWGNTNITWLVQDAYCSGYKGILSLEMRSNNGSISCWSFKWLVRSGFNVDSAILSISGNTWTLYIYRSQTRYGRIGFEELSNTGINSRGMEYSVTYFDSTVKESTTPTGTKSGSNELVHHPVGSIYLTVGNESPASMFGGTWEKMSGGYLYGAASGPGNGNGTGTSTNNHTLTTSEIPSHKHGLRVTLNMTQGAGNERAVVVGGGSAWSTNDTYQMTNVGSSGGHSHPIPYMAVWVWKRTA